MSFTLGNKRAKYFNAADGNMLSLHKLPQQDKENFEKLDIIYRTLCAVLYNFAPLSGHPGGSISSGRLVQNLIYNEMAYELASPHSSKADIISYAAGHKALGLYAMWALRNECAAQGAPEILAKDIKDQMRLEDLLGFRRNSAQGTKYFKEFKAKPLGGHPEPIVPFVKTSTGASGVGFGSAVGMAFGAADAYEKNPPVVNILEGEGGLTAGRCAEVMAMAATANLDNLVVHLDWNQASIDSDKVCSDGQTPGDYVQWTPLELFYINDWNVIYVPEGHNYEQIYAAQRTAFELKNGQPTAIVYRTIKGWKYGLEGRSSHGAGHKFASEEFHHTLDEFEAAFKVTMPRFCAAEQTPQTIEDCFWGHLQAVREALKNNPELTKFFAAKLKASAEKLKLKNPAPSPWLGDVEKVYKNFDPAKVPAPFVFEPAKSYTTRGALGDVLGYINKETGGTMLVGSADLYGSTNAANIAAYFPKGFYNKTSNPQSRLLSSGGICEDGLNALATGISAYGAHIGVASSYAAFASFGHVAMRLHAIGQEAKHLTFNEPLNTVIMFNGHTGIPTGEDGPTHADPQALQLMQENFPKGLAISLTPFEADELWPLVTYALQKRPAVLAPFVIRSSEKMIDRAALGIAPALDAVKGIYAISKVDGAAGDIIIQGSGVARTFVTGVLPKLKEKGLKVNVYYVASKDLFDMLDPKEQEAVLPFAARQRAMGITDFTVPTIDGLICSQKGKQHTLWPHKNGKYLGSGKASKVYEEAGLDATAILSSVEAYLKDIK